MPRPNGRLHGTQQLAVELILERVGAVLGEALRITVIDDVTHPEIVRSFKVNELPSFILLRRGVEIWRHSGSIESQLLIQQLSDQLTSLNPAS